MTKPTQAEIIQAHFQAGGGPLTHIGIAGLLDVAFVRGSGILSELEVSPLWNATITGSGNRRLLTGLEPAAQSGRVSYQQVADHLRANPDLSASALAMAVGCGIKLARRVRKDLIEDGEIHQSFVPRARRASSKQPKRAVTGRKGKNHTLSASEREKLAAGWVVPTGRPKCDEPHLAKAARFRQLWPVAGRAV